MDDRTLLEKAAKAAGIRIEWARPFVAMADFAMVPHNASTGERWDPFTDDGDALRLAVTLRLTIDIRPWATDASEWCEPGNVDGGVRHDEFKDPYAATRRAIVRAAAALADKGE